MSKIKVQFQKSLGYDKVIFLYTSSRCDWTNFHQHMIQEAKKKTVHVEGTWRLESTSGGLHLCEASFQKQCEVCADTAWGRY